MIVPSTNDNGLFVRFEKLPIAEAERWHAAFVETDGRRYVKSEEAGLSGTCLMTVKQFCDEVEERLARWLQGRYKVCEAAQILADANPDTDASEGISAEGLCRQMEDAIRAEDATQTGRLIVRLNGIPVPASSFTKRRLNLQTVLKSDVNEWLKSINAGYTLDYPHETLRTDSQAAPVVADEIDFTTVATRSQLIDAFGGMTKMDLTWFDNLTDAPKLMAARKFKGKGGRKSAEPLFCPFEVLQWLVDPQRRKGKAINDTTAWRLLKGHFPKVYNNYSIGDPNAD